MERDYWKYRDVETRYRLLFHASSEAVLMIGATDLRIVEANPAAIRALDLQRRRPESIIGLHLLSEVAPEERDAFQAMLSRARERGKSPGLLTRLGRAGTTWSVRASLMRSEAGPMFMLQLAVVADPTSGQERGQLPGFNDLAERAPDALVIIDRDGVVRRANRAFLDLIEVGSHASVIGERLGRWLGRPGADPSVLLANVLRHGVVRLFATTVHGELGTETEVEMSAAADTDGEAGFVGIVMRDILPGFLPPPAATAPRAAWPHGRAGR